MGTPNKEKMDEVVLPTAPNQAVLYPACNYDYFVKNGDLGLGLCANRTIRKGKLIFDEDSLEYTFSDVLDGDIVLFDRDDKASARSIKHGGKPCPRALALIRDVLVRSHGIPTLVPDATGETAGTVTWRLEIPGMLMNHSCDPSVVDYPQCHDYGEAYASRTLRRGDALTCDYCLQYYDEGPFFEECLCGSDKCRGSMMGFKALSDADKERLFPAASEAVKAMHLADVGKGLPVKKEQRVHPPRTDFTAGVPRLVTPGPGSALVHVAVKRGGGGGADGAGGEGEFALYAMKDYKLGDLVYDFYSQEWPKGIPEKYDMVFASHIIEGADPPEGTVVRIDGPYHSPGLTRKGMRRFSAWQMFIRHSCDPNLTYDNAIHDEYEDWHCAYATKDIAVGDMLTIDYNCIAWDRTASESGDVGGDDDAVTDLEPCKCGADNCVGAVRGFKYLSEDVQRERSSLTWLRHKTEMGVKKDTKFIPGRALAPHVRVSWRNDPERGNDAPQETESSSSSSSSSSSNDSSSDEE